MKNAKRYFIFLILSSWICISAQDSAEITICWDVSGSMRNRELGKDLDFLKEYFYRHPETTVTLLIFSNTVWAAEEFNIRSGNGTELYDRLEALPYDGATSFKDLPAYSKGSEILFFTDGKQNLDDTTPVFDAPMYIINSNPGFDAANLNLLALLNQAELVNQFEKQVVPPESLSQAYFGKVYGNFPDNSTISIRVEGRDGGIHHPDSLGFYSIAATPGETLVFEINNSIMAERELGEGRNINIFLEDSGEIRLDEVVVTDSGITSEQPGVETGIGMKNRDALGYTAPSIREDRITDVETDASSAVQGKFSGVRLGQQDLLSQVEIRSKWSVLSNNYGLVVIDGVPMAKANSSVFSSGAGVQKAGFIDPKNIASITVLKGLAATNRYGSLGANGVILIATKTASGSGIDAKEKKDLALLKDNIYDGKLMVSKESLTTPYLMELKEAKDVSGAYDLYLNQRLLYAGKGVYFVDVFDYFRGAEPVLAFRILSNILEEKNVERPELRALLFKARELGDGDLEYQVAQRLLLEYPDLVQSYLDLAHAQLRSEKYQPALSTLLGLLNGDARRELDFSPLRKTVERDLANLVALHAPKMDLGNLPAKYRNNIQYNARISIEWNQPGGSFELKFVNPQKRFFTWAHGEYADGKRLRSELEHGFSREEFEIYGPGVVGEWIINVKYKGNGKVQGDDPLFLNCTITYNFGKPGQYSREFVMRLHEEGSESQLAKIRLE